MKNKNTTTMTTKMIITMIIIIAAASVVSGVPTAATPAATGQQQQQQIQITPVVDDTGFAVLLPAGWIANDFDNTSPQAIAQEEQTGYAKLATLCEEEGSAFPTLGSDTRTCLELPLSAVNEYVQVFRYKELDKRPEFAPILQQGRNITANDLFLYHLMQLPQMPNIDSRAPPNVYEDKIQQEEVELLQEVAPNSVNTVSTTEGQIVLMSYTMIEPPNPGFPRATEIHSYNLYFVDPMTNDGYRLVTESSSVKWYAFNNEPLPPEMQTIFNTASIIIINNNNTDDST